MKLLLVLLFTLSLHAAVKNEMLDMYQKDNFLDACNVGFNNFKRYKKDEEFLSLYSFSCLKSDQIDRLAIPIALLKFSAEARANSAYFSVIFMQKKLLYHALIDNYDLSSLNLPTTDYILSKVFDSYAKLGKHTPKPFYLFNDKDDNKRKYKLYLIKSKHLNKIIIEEFYDTINVKRHVYW